MQGSRLGGYEILEKLGAGGMGEVWRARDPRLDRYVAIKILPPGVASDPSRQARFEQEARALAALNHPNVVGVYGAGADDGKSWIASELVSGESLRAVIDRGRLPARRALEFAIQIADAIAAAHAAGIIHRDLKPENIMIAADGRVKVLDFGLAKQNAAAPSETSATMALSQPGTVLGTAGYMSPEQVRGVAVDQRSDIFSLGIVLYEMVTGRRAFEAPSTVETMNAILHDDPADIGPDVAGVPAALIAIVNRCLAKRPEQRFQSAADLAFALRSISTSTTASSQIAPPLAPASHSRRAWLMTASYGGAAAAAFAVGFLS